MKNANVFESEETLPLTKVAEKLIGANSIAFTVCFTCKAKEDAVK